MLYLLAVLMGGVAGLRTVTAPAAVSWAAWAGVLDLGNSWLAFLAHPASPWLLSLMAAAEFVTDKLSFTPSRKVPVQFAARIVSGALCGAAIGTPAGSALAGAVFGVVGAVAGTLGGAAGRARLAAAFGKDLPAAVLEDVVAVGCATAIVLMMR